MPVFVTMKPCEQKITSLKELRFYFLKKAFLLFFKHFDKKFCETKNEFVTSESNWDSQRFVFIRSILFLLDMI